MRSACPEAWTITAPIVPSGGEGTGGQSFHDFDWKAGDTYRFLVTCEPDGGPLRCGVSIGDIIPAVALKKLTDLTLFR